MRPCSHFTRFAKRKGDLSFAAPGVEDAGRHFMKWFAKAMTFQILSRVPGGDRVHHALQGLTGSTEQTHQRMEGKVRQTLRYWRWLETNTPPGWLSNASHLELGTGWLPSVPVTM